jgi:hypothetical protein
MLQYNNSWFVPRRFPCNLLHRILNLSDEVVDRDIWYYKQHLKSLFLKKLYIMTVNWHENPKCNLVTILKILTTICWNVTLYSVPQVHQYFIRRYWLYLEGWRVVKQASMQATNKSSKQLVSKKQTRLYSFTTQNTKQLSS